MRNLIAVALGSLVAGVAVTALTLNARSVDRFRDGPFAQAGTVVACEPGQRAVVTRGPAGSTGELVECVTAPGAGLYGEPAVFAPAVSGSDIRILRASSPAYERAPVVERQVVYRDATVRRVAPRRSWQKSALIIGGSAGAGAGVGAAIGGKKGALIGAAIGGGAATVYDQVTRRR